MSSRTAFHNIATRSQGSLVNQLNFKLSALPAAESLTTSACSYIKSFQQQFQISNLNFGPALLLNYISTFKYSSFFSLKKSIHIFPLMPPAMLRNGQSLSAISGMPPIDSPDHLNPTLPPLHCVAVAVGNWAPMGVQDRWRYATPSSDQQHRRTMAPLSRIAASTNNLEKLSVFQQEIEVLIKEYLCDMTNFKPLSKGDFVPKCCLYCRVLW